MKKLILSLALAFAGAGAFAQVDQGNIALGGTIMFRNADLGATGTSENAFGFDINGGYFVTDGLEVGLRLGFIGEDKAGLLTPVGGLGYSKNYFNVGLFARKYFNLADKFYFTGAITGDYFNNTRDAGTGSDVKVSGFNIALTPGFAWFPSDNWGIQMNLSNVVNYNTSKVDGASNSSNDLSFMPGIGNLSLGVRYFMGR